jgi:hypothetical protein
MGSRMKENLSPSQAIVNIIIMDVLRSDLLLLNYLSCYFLLSFAVQVTLTSPHALVVG